jgi:ribosomal-protein-alanine N-acetyltransferase
MVIEKTTTSIQRLANQLSDDVREVYTSMIPEYQQSYADYVYKDIDKEITILKRKKNLEKSFRKLLSEVYFYVTPMSQVTAEEIIKDWTYEVPYNYYDFVANVVDSEKLLSSEERENHYFQVIRNGALVGFTEFMLEDNELKINLGMKPKYIGQGWGRDFFQAIEAFAVEKYVFEKMFIVVADFNKRAQKLFQNAGFKKTAESQEQVTDDTHVHVVKMIKEKEARE